jgi:glycosyltransferase involved in cell wall biosynthesis
MKILILSWYFPPSNTIGAVRIGNFAKHLIDHGHEVRVVTVKDPPYQQSLMVEFPKGHVEYTRWADVNALPKAVALAAGRSARGRAAQSPPLAKLSRVPTVSSGSNRMARLRHWFGSVYVNAVNWPDSRIGWFPFALRTAHKLTQRWCPELIFASGPPFTTLLVGRLLARRIRTPWVAEFRDRWSDDPYYPPPRWRRMLDRYAEGRIVSSAAAVVTVSEPWANTYRETYGKPTAVIYNGYDPEVFAINGSPHVRNNGVLRIVYMGGIYPGRRDPSPLFEALADLDRAAENVRVEFYGTKEALVMPLAASHGVTDRVVVYPRVTHDESLKLQREADVLLLMQWNDPREQGNVPGKFFEYLGAKRPILILGLEDGVPASIVRERNAGFFGSNPHTIAKQLKTWIRMKQESSGIPALPEDARAGFSRQAQFRKLEAFLEDILRSELGN